MAFSTSRYRHLPVIGTLLVGGLLTLLAFELARLSLDESMRSTFLRDTDKIALSTDTRLRTHFDVLRGLRGLYSSSKVVDRREFADFVRELDLVRRYPGFQALQFVRKVPDADLRAFERHVQQDRLVDPRGYPNFKVIPPSENATHYIIEFCEPMAGNEAAFGFDLGTAPIHLDALHLGRDTNEIVATPPIRLRQEVGNQSGFVVRLPIYHRDLPAATVEERRAALVGFVATVFRTDDLMREIVDRDLIPNLHMTIEDAGFIADEAGLLQPQPRLLYDTRRAFPDVVPNGAELAPLATTLQLDVGTRRWKLHFQAYDGGRYARRNGFLFLIAFSGSAITLLLTALVLVLQRRRVLAEQLGAALAEQRAFLDTAAVGIALWTEGRILRSNRGIEEMFGYGPGELIGTSGRQLFPGLQAFSDLQGTVNAQAARDYQWQGETEMVRKDGSHLWCAASVKVVDPANPGRGLVWVLHDITARKRAEAALVCANEELEHSLTEVEQQKGAVQQAHDELSAALDQLRRTQETLIFSEKMASLGSMVAGIAHELNTPIGNSLLTATALSDRVNEFEATVLAGNFKRSALLANLEDTRTACTLLAGSLHKAAQLIASFKQVAVDQTSDERRCFDLANVLSDTLATYAVQLRRNGCEVTLQVPPDMVFESYPGALGQVMNNLINNALLHAFPDHQSGCITIDAQTLSDGQVEIRFADNGAGMSAEVRRHIFDPFFTTRMGQGGSGLGMNIVYNIVTRVLGGRITVESEPGQGSCIHILLPTCAPQRKASE